MNRTTLTCNMPDELYARMDQVVKTLNERNALFPLFRKLSLHRFALEAIQQYVESWEDTLADDDIA